MVHVGLLTIELHFPLCRSLKDKRMILKGLKDRLRNRRNIAIAEEDFTDLWQRTRLALVSVAADKQSLLTLFDNIIEIIETNGSVQLIAKQTEFL
jgi:uncharacterized protein YlxP (DUF503 family)